VRQYGNLSYIRTYQAGHSIPSYQPETAYQIFTRALFNLDIATGTQSTAGSIEAGTAYQSTGREEPDVQLEPRGQGLSYCYTYAASSCWDWQVEMIKNGTAEICDWLFVDQNSTLLFPDVIAKCRAEGTNTNTRPMATSLPFEGAAMSGRGRSWGAVLVVLATVMVSTVL
jgi:hypothetical protein